MHEDVQTTPNPVPVIRALVVDDYEPWRRFVCAKLQERSDLYVVGEASNGLEAVEKAKELQPDLIFLDIGLPSLNGIEAARRILRLLPKTKILFVSQENDANLVAAALRNGAKGYLRKLDANRELLPAIEAVLLGEHFASADITRRGLHPADC